MRAPRGFAAERPERCERAHDRIGPRAGRARPIAHRAGPSRPPDAHGDTSPASSTHQARIAPLSTMPAAVASFFRIVERHAISSIGTNSAIRRAARPADFRFQI
ncbi:hypothetical protein C7S16_6798 [Burkholderia thailandensis]|uniref:Uncharacterized protein n=1 Tax=Burkholderia thailandensis TaxID=57975 RepID=A0AAW9CQD6_BURTH|nr:hypothetical protein [Burkholderia thailandensis]